MDKGDSFSRILTVEQGAPHTLILKNKYIVSVILNIDIEIVHLSTLWQV